MTGIQVATGTYYRVYQQAESNKQQEQKKIMNYAGSDSENVILEPDGEGCRDENLNEPTGTGRPCFHLYPLLVSAMVMMAALIIALPKMAPGKA